MCLCREGICYGTHRFQAGRGMRGVCSSVESTRCVCPCGSDPGVGQVPLPAHSSPLPPTAAHQALRSIYFMFIEVSSGPVS